ncbi:hypothetical protein [Paenibacillus aestuarii]|uniref:Uncharacterized protein n=1 Tax=Paenibacillus aestuarii TaxID=516965 RepID=A0ABW0KB45_9BACL|nr:hypothetical protein [Paenibacillus aestuarii]
MSLISTFKMPCGTKKNYPEKLDYLTRSGKFVLFQSFSPKSKLAYIVSPKKKGVDFVVEGPPQDIANVYMSLQLEEHEIRDDHGLFRYKQADTKEAFEQAFERLVHSN